MRQIEGPKNISRYAKTHHNRISSKQRTAIRKIEEVANCKFLGKTRYHAYLFINFFMDDSLTIYPEGRGKLHKRVFLTQYLLEDKHE